MLKRYLRRARLSITWGVALVFLQVSVVEAGPAMSAINSNQSLTSANFSLVAIAPTATYSAANNTYSQYLATLPGGAPNTGYFDMWNFGSVTIAKFDFTSTKTGGNSATPTFYYCIDQEVKTGSLSKCADNVTSTVGISGTTASNVTSFAGISPSGGLASHHFLGFAIDGTKSGTYNISVTVAQTQIRAATITNS